MPMAPPIAIIAIWRVLNSRAKPDSFVNTEAVAAAWFNVVKGGPTPCEGRSRDIITDASGTPLAVLHTSGMSSLSPTRP